MISTILNYKITPLTDEEIEDFKSLTQKKIDKQFECKISKAPNNSISIVVTYDDRKITLKEKGNDE